jgi:hypothetical protein
VLIRRGLALLIVLMSTACAGGTDALPLAPPPAPPSGGVATLAIGARAAALAVGFQTQLFVSGTNGGGVAQGNRSVAWTTSDPAVVAVDANGVISAVGPGGARIGVTASDGSTAATTITSAITSVATTARVGFNTALTRLGLLRTTTNDWINGGEYSRGHLAPSADWTSADGDNAATFFLTNMLPQRPDMNGGPWAEFETFLRTLLTGGRQIYVVAGGIWTRNRSGPGVDGLGVMPGAPLAIPDSMWKVAVVVPDLRGPAQITNPSDVQVIAVNMPNVNGIASRPYTAYLTTVDAIQRSTGYDLLSLITPGVQCVLEQRSCSGR